MIVRIPSNSYSREVEEGKVDMRAGRDKKVIDIRGENPDPELLKIIDNWKR